MQKKIHKRMQKFTSIVDSVVSHVLDEHDLFVPRDSVPTRKGFLFRLDFSKIADSAVGKDDVRNYKDILTERIMSMLDDYSYIMSPEASIVDLTGWPTSKLRFGVFERNRDNQHIFISLHFKINAIKHLTKDDFNKLDQNLTRELLFLELQR